MADEELSFKIKADSSGVQGQADAAKSSIQGLSASMRAEAAAMAAGFDKLNATLANMNVNVRQTAEATKGLKTYADMAFYLGLAKSAFTGLSDIVGGTVTVMQLSTLAVEKAGKSFMGYAESVAYANTVGLNLRAENTSLAGETVGAVGRLSIAFSEWKDWLFGISAEADHAMRSHMALNGSLDRLAATATAAGFKNAGDALAEFVQRLEQVPGVSEEVATGIEKSFSKIPGFTALMNDALTLVVSNMATSKEAAENWANQLISAMANPFANGKSLLDNLGGVNRSYYEQLDTAQRSLDTAKGQAVVLNAIVESVQKQAGWEKQAVDERQKSWAQWGAIGTIIYSVSDSWRNITGSSAVHEAHAQAIADAAEKFAGTTHKITEELATQLKDYEEQRKEIQGILASHTTYAEQLDTVTSKIATLRAGLKGGTADAEAMVQRFEGFSSKVFWDESKGDPSKSHYAVGYSQHSILGQDVTKDSVFSQADIYQDFKNRIADIQAQLASQIGDSWDKLSAHAKASLVDVVYNYGHFPASIMAAAKTGNDSTVASSILARQYDNDGQNKGRRQEEAANVVAGASPMSEAERAKAAKIMPELIDQQLQLNEAKAGESAIDKASAANYEREFDGKKNELEDARNLVAAAQERYRIALQAGASEATLAERKKTLEESITALKEKQREISDWELDQKIAAAADDPEKLRDLKFQKAQNTMDRYAPETLEYKKALVEKKAAQDEYDKNDDAQDAADEDVRYHNAQKGIEKQKLLFEEEQKSGTESKQKMFADELKLEDDRTALEKSHWKKLMDIWGEGTSQYREAQKKLEEITDNADVNRERITKQANANIYADYLKVTQSIANTMSSSIMGMIQGTSNFRDMMRSVTLDIIKMFLDAGMKMVANWAAQQLQKVVISTTGEQEITAATVMGVAQRSAANAAASAADIATKAAAVVKSIMSSAAETFAGVFGFMAPFMGPAAAGPAAQSMGAVSAMAGAVSYDVGAWNVPHDQLAVVHKGEAIMTASQGAAFRSAMNMVSNGGATDKAKQASSENHFHFNIAAHDAADVKGWLGNHSRDLTRALNQAVKDGNHLGLRRLMGA